MRQIAFAVQSRRRLAGCPESVPSASLRCGSLSAWPGNPGAVPAQTEGLSSERPGRDGRAHISNSLNLWMPPIAGNSVRQYHGIYEPGLSRDDFSLPFCPDPVRAQEIARDWTADWTSPQ